MRLWDDDIESSFEELLRMAASLLRLQGCHHFAGMYADIGRLSAACLAVGPSRRAERSPARPSSLGTYNTAYSLPPRPPRNNN
jgi:hypothetical protein